jgi:glycosyltransferase involved in cell wall biosynthesis
MIGEKYLLSIGQYLFKKQYRVELAWNKPEIKTQIIKQFGTAYNFLKINTKWQSLNAWQKLLRTRRYEVIFYQSDGSYFFSFAKKNFLVFHVPEKKMIPNKNWLEKIKFLSWTPISNSRFTGRFLLKQIPAKKYFVLYPSTDQFLKTAPKKERLILSVGRFFSHLHSKKQEILIKAFVWGMKKYPELKSYRLLLAGGFKEEDRPYLQYLYKLKGNYDNIEIKTNPSYSQMWDFYRKAKIYWHAAGYKVNEKTQPHLVEHFGTSIVEAMASYCIPIVYYAGGPKEIINKDVNGFFFKTPSQLINLTLKLISNSKLADQVAAAARIRAETKFGPRAFEKSLDRILE